MRVKTVQINWHDKLPIFSVDFDHCYTGRGWRFATGGGDNNVRIWRLRTPEEREEDTQAPAVEFVANLTRHTAPVNVVRFSPHGSRLASAGDDGAVIIWRQVAAEHDRAPDEGETWRPAAMLRGSLADICDLAWSPDGAFLASASVDNTTRIWDARDARCVQVLADHSHYVQGVAWDPLGQFLATQSSDRSLRVYRWTAGTTRGVKAGADVARLAATHYSMPAMDQPTTAGTTRDHSLAAGAASDHSLAADAVADQPPATEIVADQPLAATGTAADQAAAGASRKQRLFHDDNLASFFRRPSVSPDGRLLATAAGVQRDGTNRTNACLVWARDGLRGPPAMSLAGHQKPVVAVRWAPCEFDGGACWAQDAPRMVLGVASQNAVAVYDTSVGARAVAFMGGLHYAAITDLAWTADGSHMVIVSIDGFASLASLDQPTAARPMRAHVPAEAQGREHAVQAAPRAADAGAAGPKTGRKRLAPTLVSSL
ncbi:Chromatin assembly factor 1 subunit [Coemansia sp. RSA 552]|nr:Chromatin assembly factor 1 subunit [Coemansia sp. RSA 552]